MVGHSAAGVLLPAIAEAMQAQTAVWLAAGDRTLQPDWMRQAARQRLGTQPVEVNAGHCPHVSQPELIADLLTRT